MRDGLKRCVCATNRICAYCCKNTVHVHDFIVKLWKALVKLPYSCRKMLVFIVTALKWWVRYGLCEILGCFTLFCQKNTQETLIKWLLYGPARKAWNLVLDGTCIEAQMSFSGHTGHLTLCWLIKGSIFLLFFGAFLQNLQLWKK